MSATPLSRRNVIREFSFSMVGCWLGAHWMPSFVMAATQPISSEGTLRLKVSDYPVLQNEGGSIHLSVGLEQPIIISRSSEGFHVVSSRCTHSGCTVNTFDPALGLIRCPCHGSTFTIGGARVSGPATSALATFVHSFDDNDTLSVRLPGVTFAARGITMHRINGNEKRLKLTFQANYLSAYQVHHRSTLSAQEVLVVKTFSLTPNGAATQTTFQNTVFNVNDPQPLVDLYIDVNGPTGFFSIVLMPE